MFVCVCTYNIDVYIYIHVCMSISIATQYIDTSIDVIHIHTCIFRYTYTRTGWRRPVGCLELQVIFRKRATNHRALLRKITCTDKISYSSSPLCIDLCGWSIHLCGLLGPLKLQVSFAEYRHAPLSRHAQQPHTSWEVGGWGLMSPTPRRKWYLTTGRRAH